MKTVTVKNITLGTGDPKIIVPMVGKTEKELLEEAKNLAVIDCDLVEWRIDFYEKVADFSDVAKMSVKIANSLAEKSLLVTFRTKQEGGECTFTDDQYFEVYKTILAEGTLDLLDIELFMNDERVQEIIKIAHKKQVKIVMCNHDFNQTPSKDEIVSRLRKMQEKNADICKIAVMPNSSEDVLTLLAATNEMKEQFADRPIVTMSMGQLGIVSRISGAIFGSAMTFGAAKKASAPGQVPVSKLRELLHTLSL